MLRNYRGSSIPSSRRTTRSCALNLGSPMGVLIRAAWDESLEHKVGRTDAESLCIAVRAGTFNFLGHGSGVSLKRNHLHDPWSSRAERSCSIVAADCGNHFVLSDITVRRCDDAPGKARTGARGQRGHHVGAYDLVIDVGCGNGGTGAGG